MYISALQPSKEGSSQYPLVTHPIHWGKIDKYAQDPVSQMGGND